MNGVIIKDGEKVTTLEDWRRRAGPKSDYQWQDGRSAKESAKAWLQASGGVPPELLATLESHADIGPLTGWTAEPEAVVRIDEFRGEPPNIDILLVGTDERGPVVAVVEAKADEAFDRPLHEKLAAAQEALAGNLASRRVERIERLTQALFGSSGNDPRLSNLRYQLLTACAAALAEAQRRTANRAVVLVHEFVTDRTDDAKHESNARDLRAFVRELGGGQAVLTPGQLSGPFTVPGRPISESDVSLYLGKSVRNLR